MIEKLHAFFYYSSFSLVWQNLNWNWDGKFYPVDNQIPFKGDWNNRKTTMQQQRPLFISGSTFIFLSDLPIIRSRYQRKAQGRKELHIPTPTHTDTKMLFGFFDRTIRDSAIRSWFQSNNKVKYQWSENKAMCKLKSTQLSQMWVMGHDFKTSWPQDGLTMNRHTGEGVSGTSMCKCMNHNVN